MSETLAPTTHSAYGELMSPYGQALPDAEALAFGISSNPAEQGLLTPPELHHRHTKPAHDLGEAAVRSVMEGQFASVSSEQTTSDSSERLPQTESSLQVTQALDRLKNKPFNPEELYPKETVVGDGDHIEGQQLSFIRTATGAQLTFKLTASAYNRFASSQDIPPSSGTRRIGYMAEDHYSGTHREIMTTTADVFNINGLEVTVARRDSNWRALDGVVNINLPERDQDGKPIDNDELGRRADAVMRDLLGVKDAFKNPNNLSELEYKVARYTWHHKIGEGEEAYLPIDKLVRQEVFPGYTTIVEPGKHEEYERKHGEFALIHQISSDAVLPKLLKNGLMATHERFRRGVKAVGMSSEEDLGTGGADSVFVRTVTERGLKDGREDQSTYDRTVLVLKPELMDRTDWYAYAGDQYGTTNPSTFDTRLTPDGLLEQLGEQGWNWMTSNEQMFRTGIPVEAIAGVSVGSPEHREQLITSLHESGITEVNGVSVEDFVQLAGRLSQIIDVAHGRLPREYKPPEPTYNNGTNNNDEVWI